MKYIRFIICLCLISFNITSFADCMSYIPLLDLMHQRAQLLQDVAANKYKDKQSVYDAAQERQVLLAMTHAATQLNLEQYSVLQFAQLQMDFAKQVEQYWLNVWAIDPQQAPKHYIDLTELRKQIRTIDQQFYSQLAKVVQDKPQCDMSQIQTQLKLKFSDINGIPTKPNFMGLLLHTMLNINYRSK